jgi:hypothetical protein
LIDVEVVHNEGFNHVLWLKVVPLKVNIFIWCLFLKRLATKDNLFRRHNLENDDNFCSVDCGFMEIMTIYFLIVLHMVDFGS